MKLYIPLILLFSCAFSPKPETIQEAHNSYFQMDHKSSYDLYTHIFQDSSHSPVDRASAGIVKAKMEWMLYQDNDKAMQTLSSVATIPEEKSRQLQLKARILKSQGNYAEAIHSAQLAMDEATSDLDKYGAETMMAKYYLNSFTSSISAGKNFDRGTNEFKNAYDFMIKLAEPRQGDVEIANLLLGYALIAGDGEKAFDGWMSYYRLTQLNQIHPSLLKNPEEFKTALLSMDSTSHQNEANKIIILGLAESGFNHYARLYFDLHNKSGQSNDHQINDILLYTSFLDDIKEKTEDYYLKTVTPGSFSEQELKDQYLQSMIASAQNLWKNISWDEETPPFSREAFTKESRKRFKAVFKMLMANGYFGLHMGHIVLDDTRTISQYDQNAVFNYVSIDHMVSNGYSGWFWDGRAETGGWADDGESFLQVRSAYSHGPVRSWIKVTDSVEIAKTQEFIENNWQKDDSLALDNPYSYLPALSKRLNYDSEKDILDSLRGTGLAGAQLRLSFINRIEELNQESSIYAHEGRHAIDKKNGYNKRSKELEFTAKLSEVYFSAKPKYAFTAVLSPNIGDDTSHGQANLKLIKGLVSWMKNHKDEIENFDEERPLLPQMDKLTDDQLRAAMRSMDPLG